MKGPSMYPNYKKGSESLKIQRDYAGQADGRATSSPFQEKEKKEEEKEVNQWGETPEEYKQRMIDMGLREADNPKDAPPKDAAPTKQTIPGMTPPRKASPPNITNAMGSSVGSIASAFPQKSPAKQTRKEIEENLYEKKERPFLNEKGQKAWKNLKKTAVRAVTTGGASLAVDAAKKIYKKGKQWNKKKNEESHKYNPKKERIIPMTVSR